MKVKIDVSNYLDLITSEHSLQPKFIDYNTTFLNMIQAGCDTLYDFDSIFNLDQATGDALDKLAYLAGISRVLPVDDPDIPNQLSDKSLRKVIKSKINQNHWDGTMQGWLNIMQIIFPDSSYDIQDNFDMSVNILVIDPNIDDETIALLFNG